MKKITLPSLKLNSFKNLLQYLIAFLFISILINTKSSLGQNPPVKQWAFNDKGSLHPGGQGSGEDWFYAGIQTSDGNYIGAGYGEEDQINHPGVYYAVVVKLDKAGKRIWEKTYLSNSNDKTDYAIDVVEASNGNYIVLVNIENSDVITVNKYKFYEVLEYDLNGNLINHKQIKDASNVIHGGGYGSIRKVIDGGTQSGYIIGCADLNITTDFDQLLAHATLIRLDNNLNLITTFGTGGITSFSNAGSNCRTASVLHNSNGTLSGFLLVGREKNGSADNDYDALAIKTSIDGNTINWTSPFSEPILGTGYTDAFTITPTCACTTTLNDDYFSCPENASWEVGFSGDEISFGGDIILNVWFYYRSIDYPNTCSNSWLPPQSWRDMDVALLRISNTTGALTGTVQTKDIAHFSGIDFFTPMKINDGFIYLAGNDALDDHDYIKMRLLKIDPSNFSTIWDKTFISDENISYTDTDPPSTLNKYHVNCIFGMDVTSDGGIILSGNNGANDEDYMMVKMAPDCQKNLTYTTSGDISGGHTLTSNETWNSSRNIQGVITIPASKTLTITGSSTVIKFADTWRTVDFDKLASNSFNFSTLDQPTKIVVQIGGKLIIDNGAILKGMDACGFSDGDMWEGIEVWGDPSTNYQLASNQGSLEIKNGSVIKDARCGILVDKGVYNVNGNSAASNIFGGGIIKSSASLILNCRFGVVFSPFISHYSSYYNPSKIINTDFICNAVLADEIYRNENGTRLGTNAFFKTYLARGLHFQGCKFEGLASLDISFRGTGIGAFDAGFTVEDNTRHCTFYNLNYGIVSGTSSGPGFNGAIKIENAEFGMDHSGNPHGANFQSIYLFGAGLLTTIKNNSILVPAHDRAFGIEYDGCTSFICQDNTITGEGTVHSSSNFGVIVSSSFDQDNIVYRNSFNNLTHSCTALFYNGNISGLQYKCNVYNNTSGNDIEVVSQSVFSTNISPGTVRINQGNCLPSSNSNFLSSPAGNTFLNACITSGNASRIFLDPIALQTQAMFYSYNNSSGNYDPGSPSNNCITSGISTSDCNIFYGTNDNPCPDFTNPCPTCLISNIQNADGQIFNLKSLIDGGNTEQMINFIQNPNISSEMLIHFLDSAGRYLSNEVLAAVMEEADRIANSELRDVIVQNSPLADSVYQLLLETNPVIAGNSEVVTAQLTDLSPRDVLELQIGQLQGIKRQSAMQLIEYYLTHDSVPDDDSASSILLAANYTIDAAGMKASMGDYTNAQTLLMSYIPKSQEELDEKKLMETYLSLLIDGKRWDSLGSEQLEEIQTVALGIGPAAARAKAILLVLGIGDIQPQIPSYEQSNYKIASVNSRKYTITNYYTFSEEAELKINPNPASNKIVVTYRFPYPSTNPMLIIRDFTGKQLLSSRLPMNENTQTIELSGFQQGAYIVQLLDSKSILKSASIVKLN